MTKHLLFLFLAFVLVAPAQAQQRITIGGMMAPGTAGEVMWRQFMAELDEAGGFDARYLLSGELGPEETVLANMRRGRVDYANISAHGLSTVVPEIGLLSAPYLFNSEEEAFFVYDNYLFEPLAELLAERGIVLISLSEVGWDHIYAREPIVMPKDAEGYRFRVLRSPGSQKLAEAIGADAIGISYVDVMPSLQTGLIDGGQSPITMYARTGIARYAPHLTLTYHSYGTGTMVAAKRFWDRLSPAQQTTLANAFPTAEESRRMVREEREAMMAEEAEEGTIIVHELTPEQRAAWVAATAQTHQEMIEEIGGEAQRLYDIVEAGKRAFAEQQASENAE